MQATISKDGKIQFDYIELLESLTAEAQIQLIESLSCFESVIKHVMDQVLEGWTENSFSGSDWDDKDEICKARARITKEIGDKFQEEKIIKLQAQLELERETSKEYRDLYYQLYHAWPNGVKRPETEI